MIDDKQLFARNLKRRRTELHLSQAKLAEMLSYTGKAVSKWESGSALPPAEVLPKLARVMDTDLNSLFDFRESPSYFLGIDGGGTKTRFVLTDADGKTLNCLSLGACNPSSVGIDVTLAVLNDGIKELCKDIPYGKISVFAGIAGCGVSRNAQKVLEDLERFRFSRVRVDSDAESIVAAGLCGKDGIIAILGTGSIIYSSIGGKRHRIGGYGHFIGDIFSGSELGRACLEAVLYDLDGSGRHTSMTAKVTEQTGNDISAVLSKLYDKGKAYMASFAHFIFECAAEKDAVAEEILENNIIKLADKLSAALRMFPNAPKSVPIVLAGGITRQSDGFSEKLTSSITDTRLCSIQILSKEPVFGALMLAGAPINKENSHA